MKPRSVFLGGIILEGALVIIAILISYWRGGAPLLNPIRFDLEGLGLGIAATLPMVAYFAFSLSRFGRNIAAFKKIYKLLREILSRAIIEMPTWQIAVLGMSAGLGEECLFRGALQHLRAPARTHSRVLHPRHGHLDLPRLSGEPDRQPAATDHRARTLRCRRLSAAEASVPGRPAASR